MPPKRGYIVNNIARARAASIQDNLGHLIGNIRDFVANVLQQDRDENAGLIQDFVEHHFPRGQLMPVGREVIPVEQVQDFVRRQGENPQQQFAAIRMLEDHFARQRELFIQQPIAQPARQHRQQENQQQQQRVEEEEDEEVAEFMRELGIPVVREDEMRRRRRVPPRQAEEQQQPNEQQAPYHAPRREEPSQMRERRQESAVPQERQPARRGQDRRFHNEPRGPIRRGNGTLVQVSRWMVTLTLTRAQYDYTITILPRGITQIVGQQEVGNNGDPDIDPHRHYQLYVETAGPATALQVVDMMGWLDEDQMAPFPPFFNVQIWMTPAYGDKKQCVDYVQKEDTRYTDQTHPDGYRINLGEGNPLNAADQHGAVLEMALGGAQFLDIAQRFPGYAARNANGINRIISEVEKAKKREMRNVKVYCYWGDAGTGKSTEVWDIEGLDKVYNKIEGQFFDGLQTTDDVLLLDDFVGEDDKNTMPFGVLLKLLDGKPYPINIKGTMKWANWTKVYITSNRHPNDWYPYLEKAQKAALFRRLNSGGAKFWRQGGEPIDVVLNADDYPVLVDSRKPVTSFMKTKPPLKNALAMIMPNRTETRENALII